MTANEAVVAGSPKFLGALLEQLTARLGGPPRVADSPHLAFALCQDSARLLVYECCGQEWLPLCEDLRRFSGAGLSIVVALPPEHAAQVANLSGTASAVVAWSGDPRPVLEAVSRVVAPQAAPAPGRPAPVLAPAGAGGAGRQAIAPAPARPAAAPARPAVTPVAARTPVAPAQARPAVTPVVARPAVTPAPVRPAVTPARPALTPVVARPAVPPPTARPPAVPVVPAAEAAKAPRPVMAAAPVAPRASPAVAATPSVEPAPAATPAHAVAPVASPVHLVPEPDALGDLFDEPTEDAVPPSGEGDPEPTARPPSAPPVAFLASSTWPGTVLAAADAEGLLSGALVGLWPEEGLRPITEKVIAGLSVAEKAALQDRPLPLDPGPVKRATGLRWQVAAALATAPAAGTPVDHEALKAILAGLDAVLADLKAMSEGATPEALRVIESVRHAVVKEAIDLTETVQRIVPAEVVAEITSAQPLRAPETRVLFSTRGVELQERRKPWGMIVMLGLAVAVAVGYHGYRYVNRPRASGPAVAGAPSGSVANAYPQGKLMFAPAGKHLDPREVESFKNAEIAKGNEVLEVLPGTFIVVPAGTKGQGTGAAAPPAQGAKP